MRVARPRPWLSMQRVEHWPRAALEAAWWGATATGRGQGSKAVKHMALTASSRWHQLLKVTLLINGFTSKLYFYRYAPMQLNVALLSR